MSNLAGKTALVTGASAGIGEATALAMAKAGMRVIVVARRRERLIHLVEVIGQNHGVEALALDCDLRDRDKTVTALESLSEGWQAIDVLVNNAGLARGTDRLYEGNMSDWDEVLDVNVRGLLAVSRTVIPGMLRRGRGHIVNLGSIAGYEAYPGGAVYCASKFAVRALTRGLKMDLQGTPLRVTSIDPGLVETEFSRVRFRGDETKASKPYEGITPLSGKDIAEAVIWAVSRPEHVNVMSMTIFPTAQASAMLVDRG